MPALWLQSIKWRGKLSAARVLGYLTAETIRQSYIDEPLPEALVPVPLSRRRLARRGFNQSEVLARWIGRELSIPVNTSIVRRTRHTAAQTTLSRRQRRLNVRAAFAVDHRLEGRRIAVVDDVMTTGATLSQVARALSDSGAGEVHLWPVARRQ
ncbi:MAG: phosphoribosyltransferase family protein [Pseudomonadaceae bacterium]|nr:phosphoribosyltransferase family protein [Pseudomonadaceae bacterium]